MSHKLCGKKVYWPLSFSSSWMVLLDSLIESWSSFNSSDKFLFSRLTDSKLSTLSSIEFFNLNNSVDEFRASFCAISSSTCASSCFCLASASSLSKFRCFLSSCAATVLDRSRSAESSSTSPWSLVLVFSREPHRPWAASTCSSESWRRATSLRLASSSSSVRWIASTSYLVRHWTTYQIFKFYKLCKKLSFTTQVNLPHCWPW